MRWIFFFVLFLLSSSSLEFSLPDVESFFNKTGLVNISDSDGEPFLNTNLMIVQKMISKQDTLTSLNKLSFYEMNNSMYEVNVANEFFKFYFASKVFMDSLFPGFQGVCLKKGLPINELGNYFAGFKGFNRIDRALFFKNSCLLVEFGVYSEGSGELYWSQKSGKRRREWMSTIEAGGESLWRKGYIGHQYVLIGSENQVESVFEVDSDKLFVVASYLTPKRTQHKPTFSPQFVTFLKRESLPPGLWGSVKTYWNNNVVELLQSRNTRVSTPPVLQHTWVSLLSSALETKLGRRLESVSPVVVSLGGEETSEKHITALLILETQVTLEWLRTGDVIVLEPEKSSAEMRQPFSGVYLKFSFNAVAESESVGSGYRPEL